MKLLYFTFRPFSLFLHDFFHVKVYMIYPPRLIYIIYPPVSLRFIMKSKVSTVSTSVYDSRAQVSMKYKIKVFHVEDNSDDEFQLVIKA